MTWEEDVHTEFEEQLPSKFQRKVVGFANTDGGKVYLGIRDDGTTKGVRINQKLKDDISRTCQSCKGPLSVEFEEIKKDGEDVLIIKVPKGEILPHLTSKGEVVVRDGTITRPAEPKEIHEMVIRAGHIQFEKQTVKGSTLKDLDIAKINDFLRRGSKPAVKSISDTNCKNSLENLGAIVRESGKLIPTTAGLLFFAKLPQKFVSHSRIQIARYEGSIRVNFIDKADLIGSLIEIIEEAEKFIKRNTRRPSIVTGLERVELPEYPDRAVREALVNAVAHREYKPDNSPIQVSIFDDRIEFINSGVPDVPLKELEGLHKPRNISICKLLREVKMMEGWGTGIESIKETLKAHGLKEPSFSFEGNFFKVVFHGPGEKILQVVKPVRKNLKEEGVNERQIKVLIYLSKKGVISHREFCEMFDVENWIAKKELEQLVKKGYVDKFGKGLDSYFKPKE